MLQIKNFISDKANKFLLLALFFLYSFSQISFTQPLQRFEAEVTVKEQKANGQTTLYKGKVYCNKPAKLIVYDFFYPSIGQIAITESKMYRIANGKIVDITLANNVFQTSVFNLVLSGTLSNFGLESSPYKLETISKEGELTITEWKMPDNMKGEKPIIKLARKEQQLTGVLFCNDDGTLQSRQLFSDYIIFQGIEIPTRVVAYKYYAGGKDDVTVTNFKNILLNNFNNESHYRFNPDAFNGK